MRDHTRPQLHAALRLDPTEYDFTVFRITSEISRQVFPVTLDLDDPRFRRGLDRLSRISAGIDAAKARGGVVGAVKRAGLTAAAAFSFVRLLLLPARANPLPTDVRLSPTW